VQHASHLSIATADCYGGRAEDEPARGCYISSCQREKASLSIHIARTAIFDLRLTLFDTKSRINVIKEVRAMPNLGLNEAKEIMDGTFRKT